MVTEVSEVGVTETMVNEGPSLLLKGVMSSQPQARVPMWEWSLVLSDNVIN